LETHWELKEHIGNLMGENKIHKTKLPPSFTQPSSKEKQMSPLGRMSLHVVSWVVKNFDAYLFSLPFLA